MAFPAVAPNARSLPYAIRTRGWALAVIVGACGTGLAAGLFLVLAAVLHPHPPSVGEALLLLVALAVAGLCALRLWRLRDPEVELYPDRLVRQGLLAQVTLYRADIEGVSRTYTTRSGSYFNIMPLPGRGHVISFAGRLRNDPVFAEWLSGAPDPADLARAADRASVLADARYGPTEADRSRRLQWARSIIIGFSVICAGLALWLGFLAPPGPLSLAVALACLSVAFALVAASNGLIIVWRPTMGVRPTVLAAFLPAAALAFRGLLTIHLLTVQPLVICAGVVGIGAALALIQQGASAVSRTQSALALGVFAAVLVYGMGAFLDSLNVDHPDGSFVVQIQDKHESHGRSTSYYLDLDAWGDQPAMAVSVSSALYDSLEAGDHVCIDHYPGDLRLPWFNIGLCKDAPHSPLPPAAPGG